MKFLAMVLVVAFAVILGFTARGMVDRVSVPSEPYCPQEDSCRVDYQHGVGWVVREVTP